jgi:iron complex outermembrane receptor protein
LQALSDDKVLGHDNNFVIGASVDRSKIGFRANSELGFIYPDLFVGPNVAVPGTGQIIHTAGNLGFSPVSLGAWQTYYGAYFNETFDLTAVADRGRTLQSRRHRHGRFVRHQP